jgi:RNA polymerase sigma-70 factor (ECF subfamily)
MNVSLTIPRMPSNEDAPGDLAQLSERLRPRLHRYVARMAGSALDGEDIVQDALAKAALHYDPATVREPDAWLFRIAHNAALDFLRHRALERSLFVDRDGDLETEHPSDAAGLLTDDPVSRAQTTAAALSTFMQLPARQRSAVILFDVLGHALDETAQLLNTNVSAVKAALHRGRTRLRELGRLGEASGAPTQISPEQHSLVQLYAQRFNARDFDGLRDLLAQDVRLNLPGRVTANGKAQVSGYFGNYAKVHDVRATAAVIEGRPGLWMTEDDPAQPPYPVVLAWRDGQLTGILDFRYARYVGETLLPARQQP